MLLEREEGKHVRLHMQLVSYGRGRLCFEIGPQHYYLVSVKERSATSQRGEGYTSDALSAPRHLKVRGAVLEKDGQSSPANDHPINNLQCSVVIFIYVFLLLYL